MKKLRYFTPQRRGACEVGLSLYAAWGWDSLNEGKCNETTEIRLTRIALDVSRLSVRDYVLNSMGFKRINVALVLHQRLFQTLGRL